MAAPSPYDGARRGRDDGIERAALHSGESWQATAFALLQSYAQGHAQFLAEDVRLFASLAGLESPPDNRAWGAVIRRAVVEKTIAKDGYMPAKTGHMRPMPVWKSLTMKEQYA